MQELTHLSLCSGIGGLDLAAEWAGFKTIAQCEIDDYASKVLAKNFKGVPNLNDIRTVTAGRLTELGINPNAITVISAGFPCQPYSLAGKGKGDSDERDLWGEVARVIGELRPKWFVGENTPGLFSRENQRYFRRVLDDLTALGYSVGWGIWGACDVGAPHKRHRVFIVAYRNFPDARSGRYRVQTSQISARWDGAIDGGWWETEPDVGRVAYGVSAQVDRLRCLGNAVVPYQALPIFEAIAEIEIA